jgi:hypothetical protein
MDDHRIVAGAAAETAYFQRHEAVSSKKYIKLDDLVVNEPLLSAPVVLR